MTATATASAAAGDMAQVRAIGQQMKTMLGQINNVRAQASESTNQAKGKLASAAATVTGGTGTGQILQTRVGQSQVKLEEIQKLLGTLANMCDGLSQHAAGVEQDIRIWSTTLSG